MEPELTNVLITITSAQAATNQKLSDLADQLIGGNGREGIIAFITRQQSDLAKDLEMRTKNLANELDERTRNLARELELRTQNLAKELEGRNNVIAGALESLRTRAAVGAWKLGTVSATAGALLAIVSQFLIGFVFRHVGR